MYKIKFFKRNRQTCCWGVCSATSSSQLRTIKWCRTGVLGVFLIIIDVQKELIYSLV